MNAAHTWVDVALAFVLALPAIIAACSSLRNGRKIEKLNGAEAGRTKKVKKRPKPNGQHPDWYTPPKL